MIQRILRRGSVGPDVGELQLALKKQGPSYDPGPVDNDFGDLTENALRIFQADKKLVMDGIAGPMTYGKLGLVPTPIASPAPIHQGFRLAHTAGLLCPVPSERCEALDISRWQSKISDPFGVDKKYDLIIAKATEGLDYQDSAYNSHREATRKSTMEFTAYHWFNPYKSPEKQADFFMKTAQLKSGDLFPMIDWEQKCDLDPMKQIEDLDKLGSILIKEFGGALLYHGYFFLQERLNQIIQIYGSAKADEMCEILYKYLPVIAWYGVVAPKISAPWDPSDIFMWQWQANDKVEGIVADSVDHNWVYHKASDLPKFRIK